MPYTINKITDKDRIKAEALHTPPFGPGFTEEEIKGVVDMEVIGSSFDDPGEDGVQFVLTKEDGTKLSKTIRGY